MPAEILFSGIGTFFTCLAFHVILWRFYHPKRHALALFGVFFTGGAFVMTVFHLFSVPAMFLHAALSCGYIQLYPACQAQSPSVTILKAVGERPMTEAEIRSLLDPEKTFQNRIEDLTASGLVKEQNGKLSLSERGRAFILPFIVYRRLLGIPEGKG